MKRTTRKVLVGLNLCLLAAGPVAAADVSVAITNLTHGNHFTPLLVSAHATTSHLFQAGMAASANLRAMAECGDTAGLLTDLGGADTDTINNPASGLLAPGATTTTSLMTTVGNSNLSVVAMVLPTNDAFVGVDGLEIPTTAGTYTYYLNAYDAGTEANDEILTGGTCVVGLSGMPGAPGGDAGTGASGAGMADTNTMVHVHRGVLGDTNATGGVSDLNSTIHRWQNPVAKLVLTVQ